VLLGRPHEAKIETVNDADCYLANFWRAVTFSPDEVAMFADWPVNEVDLHARHKWLVGRVEFRERMRADPDYFDAKIAGWWVWGLCQWIGGGWCVEPNNHKHPKLDGIGKGVHSDRGHTGMARRKSEAHMKKRPDLDGTSAGRGVHSDAAHRKLPDITGRGGGKGVHSDRAHAGLSQQIPDLRVADGASGRGVHASGRARRGHHRAGADWEVRPDLDGTTPGRG